MSNRPNTKRRKRRQTNQSEPTVNRNAIIYGAAGVVAVIVAVVLAISIGESDDAEALEVSSRIVVEGGESLSQLPQSGADPMIGQPAPSLQGQDLDGAPLSIVPGEGGPQLLVFAAHWCPHCQAEIPRIAGPIGERLDTVDPFLISTSVDQQADNYPPSDWLAEEDWPTPVLMDDADRTAATAYGLTGFPFFVFIDADGEVVLRLSGEQDTDTFTDLVDQLASGELAGGGAEN